MTVTVTIFTLFAGTAAENEMVELAAVTVPGVILKEEEVAEVNPPDVAVKVYPVPTLSMTTPGKLETPEVAVIVVVPDSVPPTGLFPIEIEIPDP